MAAMSIFIWIGSEHSAAFFPVVFAVLYLAMIFFARFMGTALFRRDMLEDPVWTLSGATITLMFGYSVVNGIVGQILEFWEIGLLLLVVVGLLALANIATTPPPASSTEPATA